MKRKVLVTLCCGLFILSVSGVISTRAAAVNGEIASYQPIFRPVYTQGGQAKIAIRQLTHGHAAYWLVINPFSLEAELLPETALNLSREVPEPLWQATPYFRALSKHTAAPFPLFNDGISRADQHAPGFFLTVDLCPSLKPLEQFFLESTARLPQSRKGPVPVAIALTGAWANNHQAELQWLQSQAAAGRLAITWINHSYSHPYDKSQPNNLTFLLTPGIDLNTEILAMERLMLSRGIVPAPFFRFPGLISDQKAVQTLFSLGLIPIGSDAWLALGETPQPGSIILVHGNGNEGAGIKLALAFYEKHQKELAEGSLRLFPLARAFSGVAAERL
jgi:hypothetical protein